MLVSGMRVRGVGGIDQAHKWQPQPPTIWPSGCRPHCFGGSAVEKGEGSRSGVKRKVWGGRGEYGGWTQSLGGERARTVR